MFSDRTRSAPLNMKCTWQSKRPGRIVCPVASTRVSPSSPVPTSTMRSPSTTTSPGSVAVPVKTLPPENTMRVIRGNLWGESIFVIGQQKVMSVANEACYRPLVRPEDLELLTTPGTVAVSGELVLVSVAKPDLDKNTYQGGLHRVWPDGTTTPWTHGDRDYAQRISPDGALIAFLRVNGKSQAADLRHARRRR